MKLLKTLTDAMIALRYEANIAVANVSQAFHVSSAFVISAALSRPVWHQRLKVHLGLDNVIFRLDISRNNRLQISVVVFEVQTLLAIPQPIDPVVTVEQVSESFTQTIKPNLKQLS